MGFASWASGWWLAVAVACLGTGLACIVTPVQSR